MASGISEQPVTVTLDVETTITTFLKRKASPFTDENWVVALGWALGDAAPVGAYYGHDQRGTDGALATLLAGSPDFLITFNGKFDMLHLIRGERDYAAWQDWVAGGGLVWDCQLVEYLLRGQVQEAQMMSLDEVAPTYGGNVKISEVKAYWERGVNTPDIPRQLLMDYLLGRGDDHGDIGNTTRVYHGQLAKAIKRGQLQSILLNLGSLCASIEMERNGMFVNVPLGRTLAEKLKERVTSLTQSLLTYLPKDLPFEFNWRSRVHLSALIFGGSVKYTARVPVFSSETGKPTFCMMDERHFVLADGSTAPVSDVVPSNAVRFKAGKQAGQPKTTAVKVPDPSRPKMRNEEFLHPLPGFTRGQRQWLGDSGYYSTASSVIEELALTTDIPFLKDFAELQSLTKDLGTYYITEEFDEDGNVTGAKGMLTLVGPDGIVHHKINHTSTVTGRFSSSDPNLQNLPRGNTSDVKMMFESRFGPTGSIISSDFSALEVYCQAQLTKDKQLIADLRAGLDMHCARLSTVEDKPYAEVLLLCKGDKKRGIDYDKAWDIKRTDIKVFSFQRAYGAGAAKIASHLKKPKDVVEKWIAADEARYPGVVKWQAAVERVVNASRVPTQRFVRHPDMPHVTCQLGKGEYTTFDGKRYVFTESPTPKFLAEKGTYQSFSPTERKNYPVQGLGGEWMKAAMWLAVRSFYKYRNFGGQALLCNTVHDASYVDSAESAKRKAAALLHACMEAASDFMEYHFGVEVQVPVPSDTNWGPSMFADSGIDIDPAIITRTRTAIREWFMDGYTPTYIKE